MPPNVLGENRAVDEALAELTQQVEPNVQMTTVLDLRELQRQSVGGHRPTGKAEGVGPELPLPGPSPALVALQKKQLITIRTRTVGAHAPEGFAEDEFVDASRAAPRDEHAEVPLAPRRLRIWIGIGALGLLVSIGVGLISGGESTASPGTPTETPATGGALDGPALQTVIDRSPLAPAPPAPSPLVSVASAPAMSAAPPPAPHSESAPPRAKSGTGQPQGELPQTKPPQANPPQANPTLAKPPQTKPGGLEPIWE